MGHISPQRLFGACGILGGKINLRSATRTTSHNQLPPVTNCNLFWKKIAPMWMSPIQRQTHVRSQASPATKPHTIKSICRRVVPHAHIEFRGFGPTWREQGVRLCSKLWNYLPSLVPTDILQMAIQMGKYPIGLQLLLVPSENNGLGYSNKP